MKHKVRTLFMALLFLFFSGSLWAQMLGDVNRDQNVNIVDALLIAQYYVGSSNSTLDINVMDVNFDGKRDIVDALLIAQYYVGLITSFPGSSLTPSPGITNSPTMMPSATGTPGLPGAVATPASGTIPNEPGGTALPENTPDPDNPDKFFYFSYDDSASVAAVELVKYQLSLGRTPDPGLARVWEFLNYEEFIPSETENTGLFDLSMGLWERPSLTEEGVFEYKLGVSVASPDLTKESRKNVVLTLIVDVSGSMSSRTVMVDNQNITRMDLVHYGLNSMFNSLKEGDVINIVSFDTNASLRYQGLKYPADLETFRQGVTELVPTGSTNLNAGITLGYQVALDTYDSAKSNRVVLLTDAYANTGVINPAIIAQHVVINDMEGILFSGLGISADFNEGFLNELTDAGKGAFFTIATQTDARRAFDEKFCALISVAAKDVMFRLDFPEPLKRDVTASEESSSVESDVQTTNFSYNTSQYFFEGFLAKDGKLEESEIFKLTITYKDPMDGTAKEEVLEKSLADLLGRDENLIRDAETIYLFTELAALHKKWEELEPVIAAYYGDYDSALYAEYRYYMGFYTNYEILAEPKFLDFGRIPAGEYFSETMEFTNKLGEAVIIENIRFGSNYEVLPYVIEEMPAFPLELALGESFSVTIGVNTTDKRGIYGQTLLLETSLESHSIWNFQIQAEILIDGEPTLEPTPEPPGVTPPPVL
ncbi:MAG: VWA domain-containing protein [Spirochaetales bacterium]|nr:VWA domain-containing protein [Spirochaetales bacterium]